MVEELENGPKQLIPEIAVLLQTATDQVSDNREGLLVAAAVVSLLVSSVLWGISGFVITASAFIIAVTIWKTLTIDAEGRAPGNSRRTNDWKPASLRIPALPAVPSFDLVTPSKKVATSAALLPVVVSIVLIVAAGAILFIDRLNVNPAGFFCDEAEIGLESFRLLHGTAQTTRIPLFYQHLEYSGFGTLSLFVTAPFILLFGFEDSSVRLASAVLMITTGIVIYITLRRLSVALAVVPVLMFLLSPLVIHMARTNFGHSGSMLFMSLGYLMWVISVQSGWPRLALLGGALIGISALGQGSYYVAAPLFLGAILLAEIAMHRSKLRSYRELAMLLVGAAFPLVTIAIRAIQDENFSDRLRDKRGSADLTPYALTDYLDRYRDYFSYDFLFVVGDTSWLLRNAIQGAGLLFGALLVFLGLGAFATFKTRNDPTKRFFAPFVFIVLLYPFPDIMSTRIDDNPYTFSIFWAFLAIPFIVAYGFRCLEGKTVSTYRIPVLPVVAVIGLLLTVFSAYEFREGPWQQYRITSAGWTGWQFGPEAMIDYFEERENQYDEFLMDGNFNGAYVFLDFYIPDSEVRAKARIGGMQNLDVTKRQLFGIREDVWRNANSRNMPAKDFLHVIDTIYYPDGTPAMYMVEATGEIPERYKGE